MLKKIIVSIIATGSCILLCLLAIRLVKKQGPTSAKITIGILQSASHPALDATREGIIKHLQKHMGKPVNIVVQNAEGSLATANLIAQQYHSDATVVAICTIGTLATQAMSRVEKQKPILMTAVSDPESLGVIHPGTNVCGTSDATDVQAMVDGMQKIPPNTKKVALLHNPAEPNSVAINNKLAKELEKRHLTCTLASVASESELLLVLRTALQNADAMLLPPVNTAACAIKTIGKIAWELKKPVIMAFDDLQHGILAVAGGVNYTLLGEQTAAYAIQVINQGIKPDQLPVRIVSDPTIHVNKETLEHLGIPENGISGAVPSPTLPKQ